MLVEFRETHLPTGKSAHDPKVQIQKQKEL